MKNFDSEDSSNEDDNIYDSGCWAWRFKGEEHTSGKTEVKDSGHGEQDTEKEERTGEKGGESLKGKKEKEYGRIVTQVVSDTEENASVTELQAASDLHDEEEIRRMETQVLSDILDIQRLYREREKREEDDKKEETEEEKKDASELQALPDLQGPEGVETQVSSDSDTEEDE